MLTVIWLSVVLLASVDGAIWKVGSATSFENKSAALTYTKKMTSDANKRVIAKAIEDYDSTTTATVVLNGTTINPANFTPTDTSIANLTNTGRLVKVFVTSNKISKITVTDTFLAKVAAVNSTTEQITLSFTTPINGTAIGNLATSKGYGTFVKDDYVLVTIDTNGDDLGIPDGVGNNAIASIKAANKVTGVASTKSSSGITIDGTVYPEAYTVVTGNALTNFGVNSQYEATLYTDDYFDRHYGTSSRWPLHLGSDRGPSNGRRRRHCDRYKWRRILCEHLRQHGRRSRVGDHRGLDLSHTSQNTTLRNKPPRDSSLGGFPVCARRAHVLTGESPKSARQWEGHSQSQGCPW